MNAVRSHVLRIRRREAAILGRPKTPPSVFRPIIGSDILSMAFIRVHPCASIRMGALQSSRMPSRAWLRYARAKKPAKGRSLKASWAVFIVLGIPLGLMAILGPLAYAGYYIEPLKQFWRPWPPDYVKGILAVSGFAITLGILLYSHGREAAYHHGKTAAKSVARNIADGLGGAVIEAAPPLVSTAPIDAPPVLEDLPVPPPQ